MRTKSRWLAILLALGLVLAACGDGTADETTTTAGEAATTAAGDTDTTAETDTTAGEEPMDITTDVGVDLEEGVIRVGLLSDLTGRFSSLVQIIVTGHEVYWDNVNANGGINGLMVEVVPLDTAYETPIHVQRYEELKDEVVAFGHSTGSPQTVAIVEQLEADGILAIPLTWYSGWTDPDLSNNLLHHGIPYCLESMNILGWLKGQMDEISTIAIASDPGDYGLDSYRGAVLAAEALGLEVVFEGEGVINANDEATLTEVANGIANSGADLAFVTTSPGAFSGIFDRALRAGYAGIWTGAGPSYNPGFIAPDSAIKDAIAAQTYWSAYYGLWGQDTPGIQEATQLLMDSGRVDQPISAYFEGFVEARIMHVALEAAYAAGDMTQAGVLAAAKSLENVSLDGLAPDESYTGSPNEQVQRASAAIWRPDPEALASGESAGEEILETNYVADITSAYEFNETCYQLGN